MWNLARLSSRENPLVIFTLATQAALGAFVAMVVGSLFNPALMAATQEASYSLLLFAVCVLTGLGLMLSASHLGKPMRFYRGYNNLRHSPVCREGLGITVFFMFAGLLFLCSLVSNTWANSFVDLSFASSVASLGADAFSVLAILGGIAGLYYMYRCYRIKARPFWNHWQTAAAFVGNSATLGGIVVGLFGGLIQANFELLEISAVMITAGLLLEGLGLIVHAKNMTGADHEGAASHYIQTSTFAKTYYLRNTLVGLNIALGVLLIAGVESQILWLVLALSVTAAAVIGRALFYVLVIPTTMPGAFFWKNKAFEQHAKDIGLAAWPQVGVVDDGH